MADELPYRLKNRELDLQEREVALKERELSMKEREEKRSRWFNPLVVAISATALGIFGNIFVTIQNSHSSLEVERQRDQSELAVMLIRNPVPKDACSNLVTFVNYGLLDQKFKSCMRSPDDTPILPAAFPSGGMQAFISGQPIMLGQPSTTANGLTTVGLFPANGFTLGGTTTFGLSEATVPRNK